MNDLDELPQGFDDLQELVPDWALPTEPARYAKRLATPLPQLRKFYDAIYPRMDAVLQHLAGVPGADARSADASDRNLFFLALAWFEASHPVELRWKSQDLDDAFPANRIAYVGPSNRAD
ncbi:hypothetical protein [Variovorax sp. LT1R16]|uniref:hypothetical protein n=1 Tax=Variovorax sp. LT1R16 TaxID=3443728 RepID=UPI003F456F4D